MIKKYQKVRAVSRRLRWCIFAWSCAGVLDVVQEEDTHRKGREKIVVVGAKNRIPESRCHRWAEVEKFNNFRESDIQ